MGKVISFSLICVLSMACILTSPGILKADQPAATTETTATTVAIPTNDDGVEAVTLELKNGEKIVVYIMRESKTHYFIQNLGDSAEVSVPRSAVLKTRKPTANEIRKAQKEKD